MAWGWLRRWREAKERAEAEADELIWELDDRAYAEARRREREANDLSEFRYWNRTALAIARRTGEQVGIHTASGMMTGACHRHSPEFAGLPLYPLDPRLEELDDLESVVPEEPQGEQFRLQFLGAFADGRRVLGEAELRATNVSAAIREAANVAWPSHAIGFRLIDAGGREVLERQGNVSDGELEATRGPRPADLGVRGGRLGMKRL